MTNKISIIQSRNIVDWVDCILLGKFISNNLPSWDNFYLDRKEENKLMVYYLFNKLDAAYSQKAIEIIESQSIYKKRIKGIKAEMFRLNISNPDQYLDTTNFDALRTKEFFDDLRSELNRIRQIQSAQL